MALTKIGSIGINTGIAFAGVTTIATLNGSDSVLSVGGTVNFVSDVSIGGTVSIAGTLTYEDVTNVDAVGLITARDGIKVGSGITLSVDGDVFATGVVTATTFSGAFSGDGSALTGVANTDVIFTDKISLPDSGDGAIFIGVGSDFKLNHNGTDSFITEVGGGDLIIQGQDIILRDAGTLEKHIEMTQNGAVDLYHNGSKKFETTSDGATVTGQLTCTSHINLGDGDEIKLGASEDLLIYHNGSDSYVKNTTGDLYIRDTNGNIFIQPKTDENAIKCVADGATELYHNNTKQCETNSTGLAFPSGKGISFAATADSSGTMANELLDDYEEGTWTPKLAPGTSYASIHNNGVGRYTKIGNMVHCVMGWFDEDCTAFPTNEQIMIYNFPFTIVHTANNADAHYIVPFHMAYNVQFGAQDKHYFYTSHNTTAARGLKTRDGTSWQTWSTADWNQNNLYFDTQLTYMTTS